MAIGQVSICPLGIVGVVFSAVGTEFTYANYVPKAHSTEVGLLRKQ